MRYSPYHVSCVVYFLHEYDSIICDTASTTWRTTWDLVEQEDPYGRRTIGIFFPACISPLLKFTTGIFTKLCIPTDVSDVLEELLSCKTPKFAFLFHPDGDKTCQRTSLWNSRLQEARFFSETLPWAEITNRKSLGVDAFLAEVKRLSDEPHLRP